MNIGVWEDIVPSLAGQFGGSSVTNSTGLARQPLLSAQRVRIWSLVLSSQFINHRVRGSGESWEIWVPSEESSSAIEQIISYEDENADWTSTWLPAKTFSAAQASFLVLFAIATVHAVTAFGVGLSRSLWISIGSADAGLILRGELWRIATALTLHADVVHLMSNVVIGGFFVLWLCKEIGPGLGWLLVFLSGALGNLINALVQSPLHNSIGASTAVFGAIGILSGLRAHESKSASRSVFVPLVAGIILLAFFGSGGERTDVGAHLFGLVAGTSIGVMLSAWLRTHTLPGLPAQRWLSFIAAAALVLGWWWGIAAVG